jgi:hypothetical protein
MAVSHSVRRTAKTEQSARRVVWTGQTCHQSSQEGRFGRAASQSVGRFDRVASQSGGPVVHGSLSVNGPVGPGSQSDKRASWSGLLVSRVGQLGRGASQSDGLFGQGSQSVSRPDGQGSQSVRGPVGQGKHSVQQATCAVQSKAVRLNRIFKYSNRSSKKSVQIDFEKKSNIFKFKSIVYFFVDLSREPVWLSSY